MANLELSLVDTVGRLKRAEMGPLCVDVLDLEARPSAHDAPAFVAASRRTGPAAG